MAISKIYVGNLSYTTTEDHLRELFGKFGEVDDIAIAREKETGKSRGFAFVFMKDEQEARLATQRLHRSRMDGRRILVVPAERKKKNANDAGPTGPNSTRPPRARGARRSGGYSNRIRVYRASDHRRNSL